MTFKDKNIYEFFQLIIIIAVIYLIFFNCNLSETFTTNGWDGLVNTYSNNVPNINLITNFIKQNPGAKLYYVRDSANFMLKSNTWVFMYDPWEPSNPNGTYLANLNGSRIFGNNMIYQVEPINLIIQNNHEYTKSFYNLYVKDINGQNLYIHWIVNLIQVQILNPMQTIDGTSINLIKLKPGDIKLTNIQQIEGFDFSEIDNSSMATGSTGLDLPEKSSGIPDISDFLKAYPGAQAWYVSKSFSESILPSNCIVYTYNPLIPTKAGLRLATGDGRLFFNGEYPLIIKPNTNKNIYGVDVLSNQYTQNINTYISNGFTLFDAIPYYETTPLNMFKFSILARQVPNYTHIN